MILFDLIYNLSLLVSLSIISGFVEKRYPRTKLSGLFFQGFLFGIVAIVGMLQPLNFGDGLIFDGRSVVLSLAAFFFGPVPGLIAGIMAIVFRIILGGSGFILGSLVIASSVIIGTIFHFYRKQNYKTATVRQLLYLGFVVHLSMLLLMFILPFSIAVSVIQRIGIIIILVYPLTTVLIGKILSDQEENARNFEKITASEEKYRYMFANNPQPMFIYDLDTLAFLEVNDSAINQYGYTKEEFLSMTLKDIRPAEDIPALLKDIELARNTDNPVGEWRHLKKNGEIIDVQIISTTILFNNRNARHVMVIDISKRKQAEEALRNNEARLRTLVRTLPDLVWLKDTEGVYLACNPMFERFFGAKAADIIGKTDYDFVDKELADFFLENDRKAMGAGKPTSNEEWLTFADNGQKIFSETIKTPMYDSTGKLIGVLGIGRDLTDRKKTEEMLRKSEERFKTIFEQSPFGIALIDSLTGHILEVNKRFAEITGRTVKEMADVDWMKITHPHDLQADLDNMALMNAGEISGYQMEKRYLNPSSTSVWINMTIASINVEDKSNPLHLCMIEDITDRKITEESLLKLSLAVEQSPVSVMITNPLGEIEYVNNKFCRITGYTREEAIGKSPNILKSGLQDSNYYEDLWNTILSGHEWKGELQNRKKNGDFYWESALISPLVNGGGDITHFIAVKEDITEQKKTRAELLISEKRYQAIFNNSVELVYIFDLQGNIIDANRKALDLFGYTEEEAKSLKISDIIASDDFPTAKNNIAYVVENGANKNIQIYRIKTKDGDTIYLETTGVRLDKEGKPYGILGIARDITERKIAADLLRKNEENLKLFRTLIDQSNDSIELIDLVTGRFLDCNEKAYTELGYTREELLNLGLYDIDPDLTIDNYAERIELIRNSSSILIESKHQRKDGSQFPVEINIKYLKLESEYIIAVVRNITARKNDELELIKAKENAEEMNRLKTNFLANMSHELRTPLIGILGYAEFLEKELIDEELLQMATTIKNSGNRLNTTLNNILDVSRIDSGKQQINLKKQDVIKLLIEQAELFKVVAERKGIKLNLEIKEKKLEAVIDEDMFVSIISNLLSNAIKFTKKGNVTLRATKLEDKAIIEIEDEGIGIPEDYREIIFEPFRQASEGFSRGYEGTGLGLTIVKKYIDLIGGTITMKSKTGDLTAGISGGTKFELKFPINK